MNTGFLLVVLTIMDGGGMSAAFVNTQTLSKCESRGRLVKTILNKGKVEIKSLKCFQSGVQFEKFLHKQVKDSPRYHYVVKQGDKTVQVTPVPAKSACKAMASNMTDAFCVTSSQKLKP